MKQGQVPEMLLEVNVLLLILCKQVFQGTLEWKKFNGRGIGGQGRGNMKTPYETCYGSLNGDTLKWQN